MVRLLAGGACFALILSSLGCNGDDDPEPTPTLTADGAGSERPSGNGACGLMMQGEVDALFGTGVGAGIDETLAGGVEICSWPSGQDPALLLQIAPGSDDVRQAVALGDGYDIVDVEAMSGPAAAAIEQADGPGAVIVFAVASGDKTITISPVGLGIVRNSAEFAKLKKILDDVANRS